MTRQSKHPCTKCGSMYRYDNHCNKCGDYQPVHESFYDDVSSLFIDTAVNRPVRGKVWDKKSHKYLKSGG